MMEWFSNLTDFPKILLDHHRGLFTFLYIHFDYHLHWWRCDDIGDIDAELMQSRSWISIFLH